MKLHVLRDSSSIDGTPGSLTVLETAFMCCTLELPWRNNMSQISCIMADTYDADIWYSVHLARNVLRLEDKHGRRECLVHNATFAGDAAVGKETQVHGCTAVGDSFGHLIVPNTDKTQFAILNSKETLARLLENIGPGPHSIKYEWGPGCAPADLSNMNHTR